VSRRVSALAAVAAAAALGLAAPATAADPFADVAATAFVVENAATGEMLAARAPDRRVAIASITKLMTVLVALEHARLADEVTVDGRATAVGESSIPLLAGERLRVSDLVEAALIQSANNAADALALHVAGSFESFAALMNAKARKLGLDHTHFVRPDGLDTPGHVSSAHDVAVLAQVAMHRRVVRDLVRLRSAPIESGQFTVHTWNDLLGVVPGVVGVKTGHTNDAGWCEVVAVRRNGFTVYAVILGSPTRARRNDDLQRLLAWGVSQYRTLTLVEKQPYAWAAAPYGRPRVALVARRPLVRVVRVGRPVVERIVAPAAISLPVVQGQQLGRIEFWSGGTRLGSRPLLAARSVQEPGLGGRLRWYGTRTVHHLMGIFS
jgi:D-alanyl-D-alanine carboxypeptidase (penicillin-binding protein 5/6)